MSALGRCAASLAAAAIVVSGAVVSGAPAIGAPADVGARAWLLRVSMPSGTVLRIADVDARTGSTPTAAATPLATTGAGPYDAVASVLTRPHATSSVQTWNDPTGSATVSGGFADAEAAAGSASARAGMAQASGSGFALASKYLTWEQQTELTSQIAALDQTVFDPLNARIAALRPLFAAAGLSVPSLDRLDPVGLLDIGHGRLASATADVAASPGLATAHADAVADDVQMLAGFVQLSSVSVEAKLERSGDAIDRIATARIGSIKLAGVDVVASGDGFHVAGNDLVARTVVQPALDLLLGELRRSGVVLRAAESTGDDVRRQAAAFEMSIATAGGPVVLSVARAEAVPPDQPRLSTAPTKVLAEGFVSPPAGPGAGAAAAPPSLSAEEPSPAAVAAATPPASPGSAVSSTTTRNHGGLLHRIFPRSVARALGTSYALIAVAAMVGAVTIPALVGRRKERLT